MFFCFEIQIIPKFLIPVFGNFSVVIVVEVVNHCPFRDVLTELVALDLFETGCKFWRIQSFRFSKDLVY